MIHIVLYAIANGYLKRISKCYASLPSGLLTDEYSSPTG